MDRKKKTIAIIEDNIHFMDILKETLNDAGYDIYGSSVGRDIIDRIAENPPDLIIVDLMLPELRGEEVIDAFQSMRFAEGIPIIILSARDKDQIQRAAELMKAAGWAQKPVTGKEILSMVKEVLENKK